MDGEHFAPGDPVTRQQTAAILQRYMNWIGADTSGRGDLLAFSDEAEAASWARVSLRWALSAGILQGRDDGTLDPAGTASRAQVAAMLQRLMREILK